ncbi:MAG TPA: ribonuclease Y [Candidatus Babeliales bacterium]|nr:ribonuclease Y [Candidatus Babeliales bacterium]
MLEIGYIINGVGVAGILSALGLLFYAKQREARLSLIGQKAEAEIELTRQKAETERREASFKLKDELYRRRKEFEAELKNERQEVQRLHDKINLKYEELEKRELGLDELRYDLQQRERELSRTSDLLRANEAKLKSLYESLLAKLENVSALSRDEAKKQLAATLEDEVRLAANKWIQKVEEETRQTAKEHASQLLVTAMQRYVSEQVSPHSSGQVHLPSAEMKGRIIGKEGRNIRALEMATGMEIVIGDAPEIITVSGFNPIRREVALRALRKLINDGRINPSKIEETVEQCEREIEESIQEYGRQTVLEFNLQGVAPEIVTLLGKLHFRTSYSQNVLTHSKEVGVFARMLAEELGLDPQIALRAGLLHDIGKAVTAEVEGPHAKIGADIAKECGEDPRVVNAIAAHHEEVPYTSIYGPLVVIADTISASRPGARRETYSAYIKRLEQLEEIGESFEGVKKVYALQAGRELRIIVEEDRLSDDQSLNLARDIARRIETEMNFPGQIKVSVIREKRAVEYAR